MDERGGTVLTFERHPIHPSASDDFEALLDDVLVELRRQPGLLWADAAAAFDDRPSYVLLCEWRTAADLDAWEESASFRDYSERGDAYLREAPTRRRFTPHR